jgi:hypothetical protein
VLASERFLQLAGFKYAAAGIIGLAALCFYWEIVLLLCGLGALCLLVSPTALTVVYRIQAYCYGAPRGACGCNLDAEDIEHPRTVLEGHVRVPCWAAWRAPGRRDDGHGHGVGGGVRGRLARISHTHSVDPFDRSREAIPLPGDAEKWCTPPQCV